MIRIIAILLFFSPLFLGAQHLKPVEDYVRLDARADDPLYTTYAASMKRSRLYGDKAYKMDYYSDCRPVTYSSDHAGSIFCIWKVDDVVIRNIGEYLRKPMVIFSFPDMAILEYEPFRGIRVRETFFVYSSTIAMVEMEVQNIDSIPHEVAVYPILELGNDSLEIIRYDSVLDGYVTHRYESPYRLISSLKTEYGYPTRTRDLFTSNQKIDSYGGYTGGMDQFYTLIKTDYYSTNRLDYLNYQSSGYVDFISLQLKERLRPGERVNFRYIRGVQDQKENLSTLQEEMALVKKMYLRQFYEDDLILFS